LRDETANWLAESDATMRAARDMMSAEHFNFAVLLARQSVEKGLKAAHLGVRSETPPRTHGLRRLAERIFGQVPQGVRRALRDLDPHYAATQYPTAAVERPSEYYSEEDAREAIEAANGVLAWLKERIREKR
jgi:HEPN domain-containing protein